MVMVTLRPRDVTAQDRFIYKGQTYNVKAARVDNAGETMTLFATVGA